MLVINTLDKRPFCRRKADGKICSKAEIPSVATRTTTAEPPVAYSYKYIKKNNFFMNTLFSNTN